MKLTNGAYDILKWVAIIGLPALGTLYQTLAGAWGWPAGEQVIVTINGIATTLGIVLGVSTISYNQQQPPKGT